MPELPEVHTIVLQLKDVLQGKVLLRVKTFDQRLERVAPRRHFPLQVKYIYRGGKFIVFEFFSKNKPLTEEKTCLVIHLGMTGSLYWQPQGTGTGEKIFPSNHPHLRASLVFNAGALHFIDPRRFGRMQWNQNPEQILPRGIDPLSKEFTISILRENLRQSHQHVKVWLMRQDRLAGIGNIYASEILFNSRLHPSRWTDGITLNEVKRLYRSIQGVLQHAIKHKGTTFSDFQDTDGKQGQFQNLLAVYGRIKKPCSNCGTSIARILQAGRSTFFCPRCQPE